MLGSTTAHLYRIATERHVCPYGVKSGWLLRRRGYTVCEHLLTSRMAIAAFKAREGVRTTPQAFIGGDRIGGYDDLRAFFGVPLKTAETEASRPTPWAIGTALALAVAAGHAAFGTVLAARVAEWGVAFSLAFAAVLRLQDVERFSTRFVGRDLLGRRFVPYAYAFPYLELAIGVLMAAHALLWLAVPAAAIIGGIGVASVCATAVRRGHALSCAGSGRDDTVAAMAWRLAENLAMVGMAIWLAARY